MVNASAVENPRIFPYMHITGVVSNIVQQTATFDILAGQWTSAFRHPRVLPVCAMIPDSPRWKERKPIPAANSYVGVAGYLT